ncbi:unnamed protein product [Bursaphelenchus xylophilus]|uniref:(pine wood nematode) hypothetical protein n=1 Tax=Bursaphelenchus xylophilus TaxID=6326 RepID=A0A1I7S8A9_BURXY|nr:unnamed protein product [Bursaphelenchus xylophilus]CAG9080334.1 unnamed protein product [Bursaphelenchus xylophilus]
MEFSGKEDPESRVAVDLIVIMKFIYNIALLLVIVFTILQAAPTEEFNTAIARVKRQNDGQSCIEKLQKFFQGLFNSLTAAQSG